MDLDGAEGRAAEGRGARARRSTAKLWLVVPVAVLIVSGIVIAAVWGLPGSSHDSGEPAGPPAGQVTERPNIVVVMTDDQALLSVPEGTPESIRAVGAEGTSFSEAVVSTPLCCPSRASFLTGQYGHNSGVLSNDPGYPRLNEPRDVLPRWLGDAGYRTAMVGKFMNGYDRTARGQDLKPAPGWEEWVEMRRPFSYYDYELNVGGELRGYGSERGDYLTRVITKQALESIDRLRDDRRPLFLWVSYWAPHREREGRTSGKCDGSAVPLDREPAELTAGGHPAARGFEADVSDKPLQVRIRKPLDARLREQMLTAFRCAVGSLREVDRGVGRLRKRLAELGELDETALVFTSDNGYLFGQHRFLGSKEVPYEEAIRVPLVVDLPDAYGSQPMTSAAPVANIDLAPTFLQLAGARPCVEGRCRTIDGRSLVRVARGGRPRAFDRRPLLIETGKGAPCPFSAVRYDGLIYAEYPRRQLPLCRALERELYRLGPDPNQLENLLATAADTKTDDEAARLAEVLDRLKTCAGRGREADRCP